MFPKLMNTAVNGFEESKSSGMGASDLGQIAAHPEVTMIALCDVDRGNLKSASQKHPDAKTFVDYREMFGGVAKWATEIESADTASAVMAEAFHRAESGRPGPVVVALPEVAVRGERRGQCS